jgi:hypothetical protein
MVVVGVGATTIMKPPWLDQDAVVVLGFQHDLVKNPIKFLHKFDPEKK